MEVVDIISIEINKYYILNNSKFTAFNKMHMIVYMVLRVY